MAGRTQKEYLEELVRVLIYTERLQLAVVDADSSSCLEKEKRGVILKEMRKLKVEEREMFVKQNSEKMWVVGLKKADE